MACLSALAWSSSSALHLRSCDPERDPERSVAEIAGNSDLFGYLNGKLDKKQLGVRKGAQVIAGDAAVSALAAVRRAIPGAPPGAPAAEALATLRAAALGPVYVQSSDSAGLGYSNQGDARL